MLVGNTCLQEKHLDEGVPGDVGANQIPFAANPIR